MKNDFKTKEELFEMVEPLTKEQEQDITDTCFYGQYLFKYKDNNGSTYGYCTCCNQEYILSGEEFEGLPVREPDELFYYKHNDIGYCSNCSRPVQIKDAWRGRSRLYDRGYIGVFQNLNDGGVLFRTFCLLRRYDGDYRNVKTAFSEHYRIFYYPGKIIPFKRVCQDGWYHDDFWYFYTQADTGFVKMTAPPKNLHYPTGFYFGNYAAWNDPIPVHYYNHRIIENSELFKYSSYEYFLDHNYFQEQGMAYEYLNFYCKHPQLTERLVKENFSQSLALILLYKMVGKFNYNAKTTLSFFCCENRAELKELRQNMLLIEDEEDARGYLDAYSTLKGYGLPYNHQQTSWLSKEYNVHHTLELIPLTIERNNLNKTPFELMDYLAKKKVGISEYRDYLSWISELRIEPTKTVLYPKNLKKAHDELSAKMITQKRLLASKDKQEKIDIFEKTILPEILEKYSYSNQEFLARPFTSIDEMIKEGQIQHICVGGETYTNKQIEGRGVICCVRKIDAPDEPFCTIELNNNGSVIQARAKRNASIPNEVKKFLDEWKAFYSKPKNKSKKEVA